MSVFTIFIFIISAILIIIAVEWFIVKQQEKQLSKKIHHINPFSNRKGNDGQLQTDGIFLCDIKADLEKSFNQCYIKFWSKKEFINYYIPYYN
nr:hypothetical protein [Muribaculaceae bacterium]